MDQKDGKFAQKFVVNALSVNCRVSARISNVYLFIEEIIYKKYSQNFSQIIVSQSYFIFSSKSLIEGLAFTNHKSYIWFLTLIGTMYFLHCFFSFFSMIPLVSWATYFTFKGIQANTFLSSLFILIFNH